MFDYYIFETRPSKNKLENFRKCLVQQRTLLRTCVYITCGCLQCDSILRSEYESMIPLIFKGEYESVIPPVFGCEYLSVAIISTLVHMEVTGSYVCACG